MFFWKILFLEKKQWRKPILTQWDFLVLLMILHPWSRGVVVPTLVLLIFRRRCNGSRRYGCWLQLPSAFPPAPICVPAGFHLRARRLPSACPPALMWVLAGSHLRARRLPIACQHLFALPTTKQMDARRWAILQPLTSSHLWLDEMSSLIIS